MMKKKVSIQTISEPWLLHNYGSFFQHYALRKMLGLSGYEVNRRPEKSLFCEIFRWLLPLVFLRDYLKYILKRGGRPEYPIRGTLKNRYKFLCEYHKFIGKLVEKKVDNEVYAYVSGGDCIWYAIAPYAYFLGREYNSAAKRIAFGVSSDWDNVKDNIKWQSYIKQAGETFTGVGVREEIGVEICQRLMPSQKVVRVVDPVFLFDKEHYLKIAAQKTLLSKQTLFYYVVNSRGSDLNLDNILKTASVMRKDCKIVGIQGSELDVSRDLLLMPSPTEFLACIRDCDVFITNSFHGIVFALIFNKPFVFLKQKTKIGFNKNRRQTELLNRLDLTAQALETNATNEEIISAFQNSFDWERINLFIKKDRENSIDWLKRMLQ